MRHFCDICLSICQISYILFTHSILEHHRKCAFMATLLVHDDGRLMKTMSDMLTVLLGRVGGFHRDISPEAAAADITE